LSNHGVQKEEFKPYLFTHFKSKACAKLADVRDLNFIDGPIKTPSALLEGEVQSDLQRVVALAAPSDDFGIDASAAHEEGVCWLCSSVLSEFLFLGDRGHGTSPVLNGLNHLLSSGFLFSLGLKLEYLVLDL